MPFEPRWRGGELPRLVDARHAALVEQVVAHLSACDWSAVVEYTFNHFGEKGAVDVVGWRAAERALLVMEVKTELDNLQNMLSVLDRKARLVPQLVAAERGWRAKVVGVVLVMPDGSTLRDGVARFAATFATTLPSGNVEVRHWVARPGPAPLRGRWFVRPSGPGTHMENQGGPRRIRTRRGPATPRRPVALPHEPRSEPVSPPRTASSLGRVPRPQPLEAQEFLHRSASNSQPEKWP